MMNDTIIVACQTLKQELELVMKNMGCNYPIEWVDSGLHVWPDKLHVGIQEKVDSLDPKYKTVLFVFGFCGNSMVGINGGDRTLVLPLSADCIPIFMGSNDARNKAGVDTYFFTQGYLNYEANMVREHQNMINKYGEKRAGRFLKSMMAHYKRIGVIDTGAFDVNDVVENVRSVAAELDIPTIVLEGNMRLIENLLQGNWDRDEFLVVEPNGKITFEDSLRVGKSSVC